MIVSSKIDNLKDIKIMWKSMMTEQINNIDTCYKDTCCSDGCNTGDCSSSCYSDGCCTDSDNCCLL